MEAETNYLGVWFVYLSAGSVFYIVWHRFTRFKRALWWSYALRAIFLALALTPWYVSSSADTLAPALMVMTLDLITIGGEAAARAFVPLILSLLGALLVSTTVYFIQKKRLNNSNIG
ncbi:MAG: hypothetical protein ACI95C_002445 [Pseudohongiellaceae bacterium]|jgi:hypothetical protein